MADLYMFQKEANFLKSPLTKESILLNFLLGFTTYKCDRYLDALETLNENQYPGRFLIRLY